MYRLLLIKEIVTLMHYISFYDPFFDTHREQCEHYYVFVLNRLSYLFSTAKGFKVDEGTCMTMCVCVCVCDISDM